MDESHSQPYGPVDLLAMCNLPSEYAWTALRQLHTLVSRGQFAKLTMFRISRWGDWSGGEIEELLWKEYGIRISLRAFDKECYFFSIFDTSKKKGVANWAEYILRREGVQMLNVVNGNNLAAEALGPMPRR